MGKTRGQVIPLERGLKDPSIITRITSNPGTRAPSKKRASRGEGEDLGTCPYPPGWLGDLGSATTVLTTKTDLCVIVGPLVGMADAKESSVL